MPENQIPLLANLSQEEKALYIKKLIKEQVIDQRINLQFWRQLTNQPAQIDTGYIAQHLVSLVTKIKGGGFRGKGDDLEDGSEVKSANFLDSEDARGAVAPRWNFTSNDEQQMLGYLNLPALYLVSIDRDTAENIRFRIWKLFPQQHADFLARYNLWMQQLGYPKLNQPNRPGVNFQLFPPRNKSNDAFARHGNGRSNGFPQLQVQLENVEGSALIFKARLVNNEIIIDFLMD
ncbi:MAG: MamI family restriction endonuclease [Bacteroidetes bacterium]|nr:MamI family restriction endonuclease [Bacteroidota bacterium]